MVELKPIIQAEHIEKYVLRGNSDTARQCGACSKPYNPVGREYFVVVNEIPSNSNNISHFIKCWFCYSARIPRQAFTQQDLFIKT